MALDLNHFRKKLEDERLRLEQQLQTIARQNPENPKDWEPLKPDLNPQQSEASEMADVFEELETQANREVLLEARLGEILDALKKIDQGAYGLCEVDQKPISRERLEANPAAKTCIDHAKD